ncbi:glutaminyl-peptide cyclotransferase [Crocinitomicaceae bacterium]|nr:glutaminyl-peptide cyclotransferase [Crocinitomicaceae bacterium]
MNPNAKKYIVIALIVLVGGALLIGPLIRSNPDTPGLGPIKRPVDIKLPAEFGFDQNLAAITGVTQNLEIQVNQKDIASMEVDFDGTIIQKWDNPTGNVSFPFSATILDTYPIKLTVTLKDGSQTTDERLVRVVSDIPPTYLRAEIIGNPLPHDANSFTQGLEFKDGRLYEGVGLYGESRILEVNLQSGEILRKLGLDASHFGEGITLLGDKLYQLTWQKGKCLVYDYSSNSDSFTLLDEKAYEGEGWGLCNNGSELILSNGSEKIQFIDPETFEVKRTIQVFSDEGPFTQLNELEFIDGKIYANIYQMNAVVAIDPATGKVVEIIDCSQLSARGGAAVGKELNGIAKDDTTGKVYMTGKKWSMLFQVQFVPAPNS